MSARLSFRGLGRTFGAGIGHTIALQGIDLEVAAGEFVAIVGPSGCGKSTLMNVAAGLDTAFAGHFERTPAQARLACMFQQPRLLPWLTVRQNIQFVLDARGDRTSTSPVDIAAALRRVQLEDAGDKYPAQLSGGMQQRGSLARALAIDPDVLFMDEPFSALDELTAASMRRELAQMVCEKPRTVLLITHNIMEACVLADRIIVMTRRPGTIVADLAVPIPRPRSLAHPHLAELAERVLSLVERPPVASSSQEVAHV